MAVEDKMQKNASKHSAFLFILIHFNAFLLTLLVQTNETTSSSLWVFGMHADCIDCARLHTP